MTRPPNGTQGPPPVQPTPLDSGRVLTELSGTDINIGNVVIEDPSTGLPFPSQNGGLPVSVVGLPLGALYVAAGTIASLTPAGGSQALPAASSGVRLSVVAVSILPTAALSGIPSLWVELRSGATVLVSGVVSGQTPLMVPLGGALFPGASLALFYGPNSGSLELHYTIDGTTPP